MPKLRKIHWTKRSCPYCGAKVKKRLSVKILKITAIIVALIGLLLVHQAAVHATTPQVKIGEIKKTMNFAYIKISGIVTRYPSYGEDGSISFWIDDGTGEIMVKAYRADAEKLLKEKRIPGLGDKVTVEGTLRVREDFAYLIIEIPSKLIIEEAPLAGTFKVDQITEELLDKKVIVEGRVSNVRYLDSGAIIIYLMGARGDLQVYIPPIFTVLNLTLNVREGSYIKVKGVVQLYRGELEVVPRLPEDIQIEQITTKAEKTSIAEITEEKIGEIVEIQGKITYFRMYSSGILLKVADETGEIDVWITFEALGELDPQLLAPTAKIAVKGVVSVYKEKLEIKVNNPTDIQVIEEPKPVKVDIGLISEADVGMLYIIEGEIISVDQTSSGLKIVVKDQTGKITVWIWNSLLPEIPVEKLVEGAKIRVRGQIVLYKETLEIQPLTPQDIQVIT